jgi:cardiolipin synthase (CMP-forming)
MKHIPNILSFWRLLTFPVLLWLIYKHNDTAFIILISVNLVTDVLDGLIARLFKLQTEFGARLDSIADITTYIAAFAGLLTFEPEFVTAHKPEFILLLVLWCLAYIVSLVRFRKPPHLHLYSTKISGYLQGIFLFIIFNWEVPAWYFYFMWGFSIVAFLEEVVIVTFIPELRSNAKGMYWMMKEKGKIA